MQKDSKIEIDKINPGIEDYPFPSARQGFLSGLTESIADSSLFSKYRAKFKSPKPFSRTANWKITLSKDACVEWENGEEEIVLYVSSAEIEEL